VTQTRRLAAILAADVAGYSRLIGADEEGTLNRLRSIRAEVVEPSIAQHQGRIVKTTGDGLLVGFVSVLDAVRYAVEVQREVIARNAAVARERRIEFRMGIELRHGHRRDIAGAKNALGTPSGPPNRPRADTSLPHASRAKRRFPRCSISDPSRHF
jgi:class 3 adenylate cyclase